MGCQCGKSNTDANEILKNDENNERNMYPENNNNNENQIGMYGINELPIDNYINNENINSDIDPSLKYGNYKTEIVDLINKIRINPSQYADQIENSIKNIIIENDKYEPDKTKIIYKQKVKVALTTGEQAFIDAADELRRMDPLPPLELKPEICIPLPEDESEMKDPNYLRNKVKEVRDNYQVDVFFKDLIKVPEVSALLMIVDDSGKNAGRKRQAVLNKDFKYIGVNSKFFGKNFLAYFAFSK